ncbi:MAG: acyltransferase [Lachnospiraceae bacterium]|nr:acyltransferase [Lachnospiraceae bacterium]
MKKETEAVKCPKTEVNQQFCILSAIAMILVVMGHVDENLLTIGDLFPYYSFHIALFLFISGYFYRPYEEEQIGAYLKRKAQNLLLPYLIWNVFYGVLVVVLRLAGFYIGNEPSLWTLFIEPFLSGHQFTYNAPAWFVPALFLVEAVNVVIRRVLRRIQVLNHEWVLMSFYLVLGFCVVWLSENGYVYDWYRIPGRIMYMLPCFEMGQFYKQKLEKKDHLPNWLYFGILLIVQLILAVSCKGLAVSAAWCNGFLNGPVVPFLTAATGIAFWLRIARLLTPALEKNRFWTYFGRHTFAVMMHQILAFLAANSIFAALSAGSGLFADFNWERYLTDVYYVYLPGGLSQFKMLYVIAGIGLPLLLQKGLDRLQKRG